MEKKTRYLKSNEDSIYDSITSLTWMAKDSQLTLEKAVSWDEAESFAKEMNKKKTGGHDDWRMPTIHEAMSLFQKETLNKDSAGADIHIDPIFPPGAGNCTWTSEVRGREAQIFFYVNGFPYWYEKTDQTISHCVRLVRRD
ncbi:MAG: DUF1566 domain-containing protein [Candidatus Nitrohelix vancouverensis]|uniref:DUF1566 domain-containing protein n=1 Tax=Candidatus Nitrohelix vancouverensis TaxID=2705534 RepID=A0A7T0C192_9BACT|nr:MAG: DUF1566 domain-containing protein [Candidatus Nitrohelix vancouverensis]